MSGGWNTIESDAGVFTHLLTTLGVPHVQFEELVSLDPALLSSLDPIGLIFLFKYPTSTPASSAATVPQDGEFDDAAAEDGRVWFAAQTIQNACGTQALLSVLMNKADADGGGVQIGPTLQDFRDFTGGFDADLKGEALSNSTAIRDAHNAFARSSPFVGAPARAAGDDDDVFHFIAYAAVAGKLYELDGLQRAPIAHGACAPAEFADRVVPVLRRRVERYPAGEIRFNLLAMCRDLRVGMRERGDVEGLWVEEEKRRGWRWENALRRHNFVGFVGELAKGAVRCKAGEGDYDAWVKGAEERTRRKAEERRRGGGGDEMEVE